MSGCTRNNALWLLVLSLILILVAHSFVPVGECAANKAPLEGWRSFFPKGDSLVQVPGLRNGEEAYEVRARDGGLLGWVFRTDRVDPEVVGFIDQLGVLVALSPQRKIIGITLVEHKDAPRTMEQVKGEFYEQFRGIPVHSAVKEVDTVTNATVSSGAMVRDVLLSSQRLFSVIDAGK